MNKKLFYFNLFNAVLASVFAAVCLFKGSTIPALIEAFIVITSLMIAWYAWKRREGK